MKARRLLTALLAVAFALQAANIRLFLTDGTAHVVREYKVEGDRVRFYSVEREDWEEVPLALVDLKKTQGEAAARDDERKAAAKAYDEEEKFDREQKREIERIPYNAGVYQLAGETVKTVAQAEMKVVNNKRRSILKAMAPIPVIAGKANLEVDGDTSKFPVDSRRPEFYIRLANEERFGILRAKPGKGSRVMQVWNKIPVANEIVEEMDQVETFKKQLADGVYRIWPTKPLEPGEYAVYEYTEGKGNTQLWDFTVPASAK